MVSSRSALLCKRPSTICFINDKIEKLTLLPSVIQSELLLNTMKPQFDTIGLFYMLFMIKPVLTLCLLRKKYLKMSSAGVVCLCKWLCEGLISETQTAWAQIRQLLAEQTDLCPDILLHRDVLKEPAFDSQQTTFSRD